MDSKRSISVCFTPDQFKKYANDKSTVVIVDLLRATTVISTAFHNGIDSIIPVKTLSEALEYNNREGHILGAERNTKPVEGFVFGNSPYDYIDSNIKGKILVLATTNGTRAIHVAKSHKVITASFVNIDAVADYLIKDRNNVIILCSGWKNFFNIEDPVFAGALSSLLINSGYFRSSCDALIVSRQLYHNSKDDIFSFLNNSSYRKRNNTDEILRDTKFCLSPTITSDIIPLFVKDKLIRA